MRPVDALRSIVIVKGKVGYEAVVRFSEPYYDFIVHHTELEVVHWLIGQKLAVPRRRQ